MPRLAALLGIPLTRRHSPVMHNAAFAAFGIDGEYVLEEVTAQELPAVVQRARDERWFGFQITAPHKQAVMPLLDTIEPAARAIGALNCVEVSDDGTLTGFNTDVLGFMAGAEKLLGVPVTGLDIVMVGTGGAARTALFGLVQQHAARVTVVGRDLETARILATSNSGGSDVDALHLDDDALRARLSQADLFVNASTVGMLTPGPVIDVTALREDAAVYDVVYVPRTTELLRQAAMSGHRTANGETMLITQAAVTFQRWTGSPDPTEIMRSAAEPVFADPTTRP